MLLNTIRLRCAFLSPIGGGFGLSRPFFLILADLDSRILAVRCPGTFTVFFFKTFCWFAELWKADTGLKEKMGSACET